MRTEPRGWTSLVVCGLCDSVVEKGNAERRSIETPRGLAVVWICNSCMRLGKGEAVRKYVMKQEKTGVGRQEPEQ
jgi:RNase P subunit RPR2